MWHRPFNPEAYVYFINLQQLPYLKKMHLFCNMKKKDSALKAEIGIRSLQPKEYWMIYRVAGFLAVVWIGSYPQPPPPPLPTLPSVSSNGENKKTVKERQLADGRGGGGEE